jgi:hypothetical protein
MATTVTTANGAISASATKITLTAFTAPTGRGKNLLRVDDEICLITDTSLSPTLGVVRGYMGTQAVSHESSAAIEYGNPNDFPVTSKGPWLQNPSMSNPYILYNAAEITLTGTTGSTAANVSVPSPAFLNLTGATGAGINFGVPSVGESYTLNNKTTGTVKLYCLGGSINGVTGATATDFTITGNKGGVLFCSTAAAWQLALSS